MNIIGEKLRSQVLLFIKQIVDKDKNGDKFIINRTKKNIDFIRNFGLSNEDIKDIIRSLKVSDCFSGPEQDRNLKYEGMVFKFCPTFEGTKLYVKIRLETKEKAVCISVHEFGKYDEV